MFEWLNHGTKWVASIALQLPKSKPRILQEGSAAVHGDRHKNDMELLMKMQAQPAETKYNAVMI